MNRKAEKSNKGSAIADDDNAAGRRPKHAQQSVW
jgi:hypothetical protein